MSRVIVAACAALLWLSGCARLAPGAGFSEVQEAAARRTGQHVHWNRGTDEDRQVAERVKALLGRRLSAAEAVQVALLNNRNLQATYEELGIGQASLVQAGLLANPIFDAEFRFDGGGTGMELALVQDFLSVLLLPLRRQTAEIAFAAGKHRVTGAVLELAGETRRAFYRLQAAAQLAELRGTVLAAAEASYEVARRMDEAGNITPVNYASERVLYEQSRLDLAEAQAEVTLARERLNTLMGVWGADVAWEAEPRLPELPEEKLPLEGLERRAIASSVDLQQAHDEMLLAAQRLRLARPLALLPELGLGASLEREAEGGTGVGPALAVPLPLFDRGGAAVALGQAELRASRERHAALAVEIRARVRSAYARMLAARERAEHYRRVLIPLRQVILEETQKEYNAMLVGPTQLLFAKQQQIEAGGAYVETLREYWLARADLDEILSGHLPTGGEEPGEMNGRQQSDRGDER